jgi:hypothetical protein
MAYYPDQSAAVEREHLEQIIREKEEWLRARARTEEMGRPSGPPPPGVYRVPEDRPGMPLLGQIERVDEISMVLLKTIEELPDRLSGLMDPTPTNGTPKDNVPRPKMAPLVERVREIGDRLDCGIAQLRALLNGLQV